MKLNILDIGGDVVKEDDRYTVKDNSSLKNLIKEDKEKLCRISFHRGCANAYSRAITEI